MKKRFVAEHEFRIRRSTLTIREEDAKKKASNSVYNQDLQELSLKKRFDTSQALTVSDRQLEDVPTLILNAERLLGRTTEGQEELITSLYVRDFKVFSKDNEVKEESGV